MTFGLWEFGAFGLLVFGRSACWDFGLLWFEAFGLLGCWVVGLCGILSWTVGLLELGDAAFLSVWDVEPLNCRSFVFCLLSSHGLLDYALFTCERPGFVVCQFSRLCFTLKHEEEEE